MRVGHGETAGRPTTGYLTDVAHKKSQGGGVTQCVTRMTKVKANSEVDQSPSGAYLVAGYT